MSLMDLFGGAGAARPLTESDVTDLVRKANAEDAHRKERLKSLEDMHQFLADAGGRKLGSRESVAHHPLYGEPGHKISLPEGMTEKQGADNLIAANKAKSVRTNIFREFGYARNDVLVALYRVLQLIYGSAGAGMKQYGFFGEEEDPDKISITIGLDVKTHRDGTVTRTPIKESVPASDFSFPMLGAYVGFARFVNEYGVECLTVKINAEVRFEQSIEALFDAVEDYLQEHSIYKGQFLDFTDGEIRHTWITANPHIVYSQEVQNRFKYTVWGKIAAGDELAARGQRSDFRTILYGPIGCGKSEGLNTTAALAQQAGWTVFKMPILAEENLEAFKVVFGLADTYGKALIVFEDIDRLFPLNRNQLSDLQNLFDGLNKSTNVSILMTTNHLERLHPSMSRPPRVSSLIKLEYLDKDAVEHLMRFSLGVKLGDDVDFGVVWEQVKEYSPAFVMSAFEEADSVRIIRNVVDGLSSEELDTVDLTESAISLRNQYNAHNDAVRESEQTPEDYGRLALVSTVLGALKDPTIRAEVRAAVLGQ